MVEPVPDHHQVVAGLCFQLTKHESTLMSADRLEAAAHHRRKNGSGENSAGCPPTRDLAELADRQYRQAGCPGFQVAQHDTY